MSQTQIPTVEHRFHTDRQFRNELRKLDLRDRVWEALVKAYRERAKADGINQTDWAAMAGKTPAQICRMIAAPRNLTLDSVAEALSALDMTLDVHVCDVRVPGHTSNTWTASIADEWRCVAISQPALAHSAPTTVSSPTDIIFRAETA